VAGTERQKFRRGDRVRDLCSGKVVTVQVPLLGMCEGSYVVHTDDGRRAVVSNRNLRGEDRDQ